MTPPDDTETPETLAWTDEHIHGHDEEGGFWIALDDPTPFMEKLERERGQWRAAAELAGEVCGDHIDWLAIEYSDTTDPMDPKAKELGDKAKRLQGLLAAFREAGKDGETP